MDIDVNKELEKLGDKYFMTEFDLVNPTTSPVSYNLFDVNTLTPIQTFPSAVLPPSGLGSNIAFSASTLYSMAFSPVNNQMYIPNSDIDSLLILGADNSIIANISLPDEPLGIAYNSVDDTIYLAMSSMNQVWVLDCTTNSFIATINVGTTPHQIAYNTANNTIYVSCEASNNVYVINCFNNAVITTVSVGTQPRGIAYNSINDTMYVACYASNDVYRISCNTNTVTGSPIAVGTQPVIVVFNNLTNVMYVAHNTTTDIYVIDCVSNTVITTIPIGSRSLGMVYVPTFDYLYVSSTDTGEIYTINGTTNTVIGSPILSISATLGIGYSTASNNLYITNFGADITTLIPSAPVVPYFIGSFNYNQFIQDIQDNPVLVKCLMLYSSNINNINQVFTTTVKNANGLQAQIPRYPSLSVPTNQLQSSVSKVCFGAGFILDVTSYLGGVTIQAVSSIKLILIQKQVKKADYIWKDNCQLEFKPNQIQYVKGANASNNIEFYPIKSEEPIKNTTPVRPIRPVRPVKPIKPIKTESFRPEITDLPTKK